MKQPKKPTRAQKEAMSAAHLSGKKWGIEDETEFYLKIINRETGEKKSIDKFRKGAKPNCI